jgi:hypothetical protein
VVRAIDDAAAERKARKRAWAAFIVDDGERFSFNPFAKKILRYRALLPVIMPRFVCMKDREMWQV